MPKRCPYCGSTRKRRPLFWTLQLLGGRALRCMTCKRYASEDLWRERRE